MKRPALFLLPVLALAASGDGRADDPTRKLTLAQVVDAAVADNPELAIASQSVDVAGARVGAAKALRLPRLSIDANVFLWSNQLELDFAPPGAMVPPVIGREYLTSNLSVTLAQPLSGMVVIGRLIDLEETGVDAARTELAGAKLDVAAQAAELALRAMQARAVVEVAERSVAQLDKHIERARVLEAGGVLQRLDVMRLESARSQAQQQLLGARDGLAQALDGLAMLLGLPAGTLVEPVDDLPAELPAPPWSEQQALAAAEQQRPELQAADLRAKQAAGGVDIRRADYYPNVFAIATYQHSEGQAFAQADSLFVGVTLKWDIWDWGNVKNKVAEARGQAKQARMVADRLRDQVRLEVRQKLRAALTKREQLTTAATGLEAAEEAFRLAGVRFAAGEDTQLGVLDAEAEVTRARLALAMYRYEYAISLVQLAHAVGDAPLAALLPVAAAPRGK